MNRALLVRLKTKFHHIQRFAPQARRVLDVGVANRSASEMACVLPGCEYHGVDIAETFEPSERALIRRFSILDLERDPLRSVGTGEYDLIVINHVLEHVGNGLDVIGEAVRCLRPGGVLYVEMPNVRALAHVADRWHYHFHDDPTHKRLYTPEQLCNAVFDAGGEVLECGAATTLWKSIASLPRALLAVLRGQPVGHLFVHARGAITYLVARRHA